MHLLHQPVFLLLVIIVLGEAIGRIKVLNFSFGSAAIIFVALAFGHYGYTLPGSLQSLGLVLFIYTIGLQAGPGILNSFSREGLHLSLGAIFLVLIGFGATIFGGWIMGYSSDISSGIFAGALTSTPGLAVATELASGDSVAAAYGVTYTFGVIGVILFVRLSPYLFRINLAREEKELQEAIEASYPAVLFRHVRIENQNVIGRTVRELRLSSMAAVSITRRLPVGSKEAEIVNAATVLERGDILRIVGTSEELKKAELLLGKVIKKEIHFEGHLVNRKIVVSRKEFVGQSIHSMNLHHTFNVQVARMTRNGIDIAVSAHRRFKMGDIVHVVGRKESVDNLSRHLGNDYKIVYSTNVLSVFIGVACGFLLGQIPLHLPGAGEFRLGTTGGVLVAGLVLGYLYHTKTMVWQIPAPANQLLRQTGLSLFMAAVGTAAGASILDTLHQYGFSLFLVGIFVTLTPLLLGYLFCRFILKIPYFHVLGVLTGGMTSTPGLASVNTLTETSFASSAYATVYPVALVTMILFTKLIIYLF